MNIRKVNKVEVISESSSLLITDAEYKELQTMLFPKYKKEKFRKK